MGGGCGWAKGSLEARPSSAVPCPVELCTAPSCRYVDLSLSRSCAQPKSLSGRRPSPPNLSFYSTCVYFISLCVCADLVIARIPHRMRILPPSAVLPPFGWPRSPGQVRSGRRGQTRARKTGCEGGLGRLGWDAGGKGWLDELAGPAVLVGPTNWSWKTVSRATSGCGLLQGQGVQRTLWPLGRLQAQSRQPKSIIMLLQGCYSLYRAGCASPLSIHHLDNSGSQVYRRNTHREKERNRQAGTGRQFSKRRVAIASH